MPKTDNSQDSTIHIGIDLGTSRSVISASNGKNEWVKSLVGWPKDFIAKKMLGKPVLFGDEAQEHRLSLELVRPLEHGVIKESTSRNEESVVKLLEHLMELAEVKPQQKVFAAVGVPAEALKVNKRAIKSALSGNVEKLIVVSEPFAVAYSMDALDNAMVIDIGAGTVDFCIMHGTMPTEEDQRSLTTAGDQIDLQLLNLLKERYPDADFTLNMVRKFKEKYAFVGQANNKVEVEVPVSGKMVKHDISAELQRACESIVPAIAETAMELIASFDPEYQERVRKNIILAGGGSQISGLQEHLKKAMSNIGDCQFILTEDPLNAGAKGGLGLAQDMPEEYWEKM